MKPYFFHISADERGKYTLYDFERNAVCTLPLDQLAKLINHCSGLQFDEASLALCQNKINFREDLVEDV